MRELIKMTINEEQLLLYIKLFLKKQQNNSKYCGILKKSMPENIKMWSQQQKLCKIEWNSFNGWGQIKFTDNIKC